MILEKFILKKPVEKTYIYPTFKGVKFIGLNLVLLIAGVLYQSNYLLIFNLFVFCFFVCMMLYTHENIRKCRMRILSVKNNFCGNYGEILIEGQGKGIAIYHVELQWGRGTISHTHHVKEIASGMNCEIKMLIPLGSKRGKKSYPLRVTTSFPFGLFRAFKVIEKSVHVIAYPSPVLTEHIKLLYNTALEGKSLNFEDIDIDNYRPGIPLSRILWKKSLKEIVYKKIDQQDDIVTLDFSGTNSQNLEGKLQTASYWLRKYRDNGTAVIFAESDRKTYIENWKDYEDQFRKLAEYSI